MRALTREIAILIDGGFFTKRLSQLVADPNGPVDYFDPCMTLREMKERIERLFEE